VLVLGVDSPGVSDVLRVRAAGGFLDSRRRGAGDSRSLSLCRARDCRCGVRRCPSESVARWPFLRRRSRFSSRMRSRSPSLSSGRSCDESREALRSRRRRSRSGSVEGSRGIAARGMWRSVRQLLGDKIYCAGMLREKGVGIGICTISVLGGEAHGWVQRCHGDGRALTWSCRDETRNLGSGLQHSTRRFTATLWHLAVQRGSVTPWRVCICETLQVYDSVLQAIQWLSSHLMERHSQV
jgi:hypothetical protein